MTKTPYQLCTKTVMDTSDPSISFDENGISNHYHEFKKLVEPNWHTDERGQNFLCRYIEQIKHDGKGRDFDCILGLSGGVDSSYMLHTLVKEYGLRPLVFHVDGGWNSEIAVHNINVLVDSIGVDLFTEVINWNEMRDFQLAMFKSGVPHLDIPQDLAFIGVLYKYASRHSIKYIMNGGNISTECVLMPLEILYWPSDLRQVRDILSRYGTVPMTSYPFTNILLNKLYLPYVRRIRTFKPLNYMPYSKSLAIETLKKLYGWKPYPQKHFESRFTRFFESYWLPTRFGYDMRRNQFSSLILTGQMTRDEALQQLSSLPYDPNLIERDFAYIASKLNISVSELQCYHNMPKKFYYDYKNLRSLFSIGEKVMSKLAITRRGGAY
jgi:N-acetyl sugar amidotransferase